MGTNSKYPKNKVPTSIGPEAENLVMEIRTYKKYKYLGTTLNREGTDD
jgi:hypothetical protein